MLVNGLILTSNGRDGGCSGVNGTKESEVNLAITKKLKNYLESLGIAVVMTRLDGNGLYKSNVDNYKQSDMEERVRIIGEASPDMVISIHCNSYADSSVCGAQVYYLEGDDAGYDFAMSVQEQLISQLGDARREVGKGDYYLLKEVNTPAIIVESGYLSNAEDEKKLGSEEYQNRLAYSIMCGVVKYFDLCGND
ncbi:MAG: N-acetylmuramoyl-L-alanine amidase [Clostridiales bacterium]|nr:N-acetylmuramoyl-L-alanine amidase [Clostridiales bacterium]